MPRIKLFSSPLWRSKLLLLIFFFCVLTICSFSAINEIYSRPLNPIAAYLPATTPSDTTILPATPLNAEAYPTATVLPDPIVSHNDTSAPPDKQAVGSVPVNRHSLDELTVSDCVTILMLGVDSRAGGLVSRTDTIMLLKVCPEAKTVALLSIPRDLYVLIPGVGYDRINTALVHGAAAGDLAQGMALMMKTVQTTFAVPIHHYILVDFQAVIKLIDALGGVNIDVPYTIDDPTFPDMNYGYDPLYIIAGEHHFDGEMALKYARTRHQDNDFYRARRQQQLLFALYQQVLGLGLTGFLEDVPTLYQQVRHGVFTDLSLDQIVTLAQLGDSIPSENIVADVLDDSYVASFSTPEGARVLRLRPTETKTLIANMFAP